MVLVTALYASVSVAQQNLNPFLSSQLFLVLSFNAEFSYIVARLVIVVFLNVCRRHLSHIAKDMCGIRVFVLSYATSLNIKTWKSEHLLVQDIKRTF